MLKSLCRKFNTSKNGFTLVELMIVVAVVALLILVLVPRVGIMKNKSREAGIRANMVMLEGAIQSVIDDYSTSEIDAFEARVAADINAADTTTNQRMKNPVTGKLGAIILTDAAFATNGGAVTYDATDEADLAAVDAKFGSSLANGQGMIAIGAYPSGGKIVVKLIPYDTSGNQITKLAKTIGQ